MFGLWISEHPVNFQFDEMASNRRKTGLWVISFSFHSFCFSDEYKCQAKLQLNSILVWIWLKINLENDRSWEWVKTVFFLLFLSGVRKLSITSWRLNWFLFRLLIWKAGWCIYDLNGIPTRGRQYATNIHLLQLTSSVFQDIAMDLPSIALDFISTPQRCTCVASGEIIDMSPG